VFAFWFLIAGATLKTRGGKNIFLSVNPVFLDRNFPPKRVIYENILNTHKKTTT
jgi:hypothetical protein